MKLRKITTALLALAGMAFINQAAQAQTVSSGDLLIGFVQVNNPNNLEIDLGNAAAFINGTASGNLGMAVSADSIATELNNDYGSNNTWNTVQTNEVQWGVVGSSGVGTSSVSGVGVETMFFTTTGSSVIQQGGASNASANSIFNNIGDEFDGDSNPTTIKYGSYAAGLAGQANSALDTSSPGSASFGAATIATSGANASNEDFGTGNNILGTVFQSLNLFEVPATGNGSPKELGTFTINTTTGDISFAPAAVPEPSTYALMFLGLGLLAWQLKRRNALNS